MKLFTGRILSILFAALCPLLASGQGRHTISGYVTDAASGETLIGAAVFDTRSNTGIMTNGYGFYSLTLPEDSINLNVAYVGFEQIQYKFKLHQDTTINIKMKSNATTDVVEITADRPQVEQSQMSAISVPIEQIKQVPALMGEVDVLRVIQLLPGVQSGGEGSTGLYVRGGGPDQNLILLDGVPVYNASHLFGFFSVFNADAISSVDLIKGGYPARYGGRLSSVLDIKMKEGNKKAYAIEGSIGLIASRLTIEGPIIQDKTSFIISARRTYLDVLAAPFISAASSSASNGESQGTAGYFFYDLNGKINHRFSDRDHLYFSNYLGNDKAYGRFKSFGTDYDYSTKFGLGWGNITSSLRWNHLFSPKLFSNTTVAYSRFRFLTEAGFSQTDKTTNTTSEFQYQYFSGIKDWSGRVDFDYIPTPRHNIKFGVNAIYHTFSPGVSAIEVKDPNATLDTSFGQSNIFSTEASIYIEDDFKVSEKLKVNAGLHASGFWVKNKFYRSLQPRFSGRYLITDDWAIKASYAEMMQFLHLLTNAGISLPTDLWLPATDRIPPQKSRQVAAGVAHTIKNQYEFSVEGYWKHMQGLIEYKDGASYLSGADWQDQVFTGQGWSYGAEVFLQKKSGKTNGWIGYTLSWTNRQFDSINFGKIFPYRYDRRHDFEIFVSHKFNEKVDLGVTFVYGTGNAVTLPTQKYRQNQTGLPYPYFDPSFENGSYITYAENRNGFRMRAYHRLDVGINFHKEKKWGTRTWSIGVYNAYSRQNPFFYFIEDNKLKQISLFPLIPSVSYHFTFNPISRKK